MNSTHRVTIRFSHDLYERIVAYKVNRGIKTTNEAVDLLCRAGLEKEKVDSLGEAIGRVEEVGRKMEKMTEGRGW